MICIIFTPQKMLVAVRNKKTKLLKLNGETFFFYNSMKECLAENQSAILKASQKYYQSKGKKLGEIIPLTIVFPLSNKQNKSAQRVELIQWLKNDQQTFRLIHTTNTSSAFLDHIYKAKDNWEQTHIILESLGEQVNLSIHSQQANDKLERFTPIKELGSASGRINILNFLIGKFNKAGWVIDNQIKEVLKTQILNYKVDKAFHFTKKDNGLLLQGSYNLNLETYENLMSQDREKIKAYFNSLNISKIDICFISLLGGYFKTATLRDYITKEIVADNLEIIHQLDDKNAFTQIADGALLRAQAILKIERIAKLEAQKKDYRNRNRLLDEIKTSCTDRSKIEKYKSNFIPKAEELSIPLEVILWNIHETTFGHWLQREINKLTTTDTPVRKTFSKSLNEEVNSNSLDSPTQSSISELKELDSVVPNIATHQSEEDNNPIVINPLIKEPSTELNSVTQSVHELETSTEAHANTVEELKANQRTIETEVLPQEEQTLLQQHEEALPILTSYFTINEIFPDTEFLSFRCQLKGDSSYKVVLFINNEEATIDEKMNSFLRLHRWSRSYYDQISDVFTTPNGRYFYRDYFEGSILTDYISKNGLDQKQTIEEFSSTDLALFLKIWQLLNGLKFAYKNVSTDNFIVTSRLKWNLKKEIGVKLVGFHSDESSKAEMILEVHNIFENLIGKKLYTVFRQKFNM
ncbi:MAG TPA: hypothetical protein ENK52_02255 [Saprospiraceae bacterium]|nr:hypothetical protein [Saprospiraceae bacterium]